MKVLVWKNHGDIRVDDATCLQSMIDVCNAILEYQIYYDEPEDVVAFESIDRASVSCSLENIIGAIKAFQLHICETPTEDFARLEFVEMYTYKEYK